MFAFTVCDIVIGAVFEKYSPIEFKLFLVLYNRHLEYKAKGDAPGCRRYTLLTADGKRCGYVYSERFVELEPPKERLPWFGLWFGVTQRLTNRIPYSWLDWIIRHCEGYVADKPNTSHVDGVVCKRRFPIMVTTDVNEPYVYAYVEGLQLGFYIDPYMLGG